ncbi:MAG: DUF362 domain-containing protein [Chthoniobacteraceae bacterium]
MPRFTISAEGRRPAVSQAVRLLIVCWLAVSPHLAAQQPATAGRSRIYYGHDPSLMIGYEPNGPAVEALTDQLVMAATGQKTVAGAWRSLISPSDHVGIKIAAAGGRNFSTHIPIVKAVLRGLTEAGIPMSQVVIWDRTDPEEAGYYAEPGGPAIRHIEPFTGYEPKAAVSMPATGRLIWGDAAFQLRGPDPLAPPAQEQYSLESHWSRLICGLNKIINIPVMSSSEDCGVAGCIYNLTVPNIDNWRRFVTQWPDPYLAELYSDPHAGPKVVLNIMDGLIAQYGGGPDWQPSYSWCHATLYAGNDPVAIDATTLRLLEIWRQDAKLPPLTANAKYLQTAATMGLGNYPPGQIDMVKVGQ